MLSTIADREVSIQQASMPMFPQERTFRLRYFCFFRRPAFSLHDYCGCGTSSTIGCLSQRSSSIHCRMRADWQVHTGCIPAPIPFLVAVRRLTMLVRRKGAQSQSTHISGPYYTSTTKRAVAPPVTSSPLGVSQRSRPTHCDLPYIGLASTLASASSEQCTSQGV